MSELNLALTYKFAANAEAIRAELSEYLKVSEPRSNIAQSVDPPSFLQLLGDASAWLPLKAAAAVYLSTLAKRAADATWNQLVESLFKSNEVKPLTDVAKTLATAVDSVDGKVALVVGLNIPDDYLETVMSINKPSDPAEVARVLASFVVHVEQISETMRAEVEAGSKPIGRAFIELQDDGSLLVRWVETDFSHHELRITSV